MIENIKILLNQGRQSIPDPLRAEVPGVFRGIPVLTSTPNDIDLKAFCPTGAIEVAPLRLDLGRCSFCGDCARVFPESVRFSKDWRMASNDRSALVVEEGPQKTIALNPALVRREIAGFFRGSLKLRQVCAGGDNSSELELNASGNVNFDISRYGIDFVASPRHADGIVITGPITSNMANALRICYDAIPTPKLVVLVGTDAISGGMFANSPAVDRTFLESVHIDLYVPGNPVHPLTFIKGILELIRVRR